MIRTLLVANRGEIARRIMRTAKRMGVATVAVASEADARAAHMHDADRGIVIGGAEAASSYLNAAAILAAAKESGADAIHPGYGFLSENPDFAEEVVRAGLIWVGPPASAIRAMGLKDEAKRLMREVGVPVTPGSLGEDQSEKVLAKDARAIGFPVLIKPVAGGGGKGMHRVDNAEGFAAALAAARREAKGAFGDDRVILERYVTAPRHIEVQIFADRHGNVVHLFERDCSLQRRHQKIIEEAPAPGMDEATRAAIGAIAVKAARAVSYEGAGTVEFIADASQGLEADRIWFMEMNTRLQVEHPVTEAITGIDLVEWQLRVVTGETLPLRQDEIRRNGHAVEARLYAEDPARGFLPSTGMLRCFHLPETVRVDRGFAEGDSVSRFYDPMLAKLIAHAPTRGEAIAALAAACRSVEVWPVKTNAAFLARTLSDADFRAGKIDTGFIGARLERLAAMRPPGEDTVAAAAGAEARRRRGWVRRDSRSPWERLAGFRVGAAAKPAEIELRWGEKSLRASAESGKRAEIFGDRIVVFEDGEAYELTAAGTAESGEAASADGAIRAPMPGLVIAVHVGQGASVARGAPLVTIEAMKMEFPVTAPFDGLVTEIRAKEGEQVAEGDVLAQLERPRKNASRSAASSPPGKGRRPR
jgi:acetyl/propionyl-CoA carboxylase alpha subunit